ncbi:RNA-directed DNA polymerase, eukaryota [Tanacetum coccineum]
MWNNSRFNFVCKKLDGKSGGIIAIWDTSYFTLTNSLDGDGFLALVGNWQNISGPCLFIVVYAPQDHRKKKLWSDISCLIVTHNTLSIVMEDFNEVMHAGERKGSIFDTRGARSFNDFISSSGLQDLPMGAKRFTRMNNLAENSSLSIDEILLRTATVKSLADLKHAKIIDLRQKGKIRWALEGDENSRLFHGMINSRRNRSRINGLNIQGDWVSDPIAIKNHIYHHFSSRFKKENRTRPTYNSLLFKHFTLDEVQFLDRPFFNLEIKDAVWSCGSDKSPGPDDFTFKFFKNHWDIIEKDCKKRMMFLKVDFEKAFDSLSWSFLLSIMEQVGFSSKWRKWIHSCLNSAFASVLINCSPTKEFKLEKGLRQGDPLSPFLFILAVEALNVALIEDTNNNLFDGIKVGKDKIQVSHLQFADDALILGD